MKNPILYFLLVFLYSPLVFSQAPTIVWNRTIGGSGGEGSPKIITASDGGIVIAGYSNSDASGDKTEASKGGYDYWIVKLNSNGQKVWDKTIGGSLDDVEPSITATNDGGFIIVGSSRSNISGDKTEASKGSEDYWIVKLNSNGQKVWDKTIGGSFFEGRPSITAANDGGFVIVGPSNSGISGDKTEAKRGGSLVSYDYWIVKINSNGQKVWDKTIGGDNFDYNPTITATSDGGFIVVGDSESGISGDKTEANKGAYNYWIIKLNSNGQKVWDKTIGGNSADIRPNITTTNDGGFVIVGYSESGISGDKTEALRGVYDYWIVKFNSVGQKVWDKTIGGNSTDYNPTITATIDGGFVIAGASNSGISGDKTEVFKGGTFDYWIVKINSNGQKVWDKTIGGDINENLPSIIATGDGGFVIAGGSNSDISGDKTESSKGGGDYWIIRLSVDPSIPIQITTQTLSTTSYCPNTIIEVNFSSIGTFAINNAFVIQISNTAGNNFTNLTTSMSGNTLSALLPATLSASDDYKIRVVSTNPVVLGTQQSLKILNAVPPTATATSNSPVCAGSALNLSATEILGATYSWTGINGFTSNLRNPTISNATNLVSGNYVLTVSLTGCTATSSTSVLVSSTSSKLFTIQSGNWNNNTTWMCGSIPNISSEVLIKSGHIVELDSEVSIKKINVEESATLKLLNNLAKIIFISQ